MGTQVHATWVEALSEALIRAIGDGRVNDKDQTGLESPPEASPAIFAVHDLSSGLEDALLLTFPLRLLPSCDDCNRDGEELGKCTCDGT